MTMNRELVGQTYPPTIHRVTADAIAAYARATNEENPRYFEAEVEGGIVASPLFSVVVYPAALGPVIGDRELGIDFERALHGEQDMRFHAAIRPGDSISTAARIAAIEAKGSGETLSIELASQNQHGTPVETTLFTLFVRGEPGAENGSPSEAPSEADDALRGTEEVPRLTEEALRGLADPRRRGPFARVTQFLDDDQTFRYAEASGDRTPIHLDDAIARKAGLPGIIGHGLCTMAFVSRALVDTLGGGEPERLARMALRFARPVLPGQRIETCIWRAQAQGEPGSFTFETLNPDGQAVLSDGIAEIRLEVP